jgi:L-malate glycosyltransferase
VVASDAGGLPEVVRHDVTGMLCPVGDVDAMAAASLGILTNKARHAAMAEAGVTDARDRFSLDTIVSEYEALYRSAIDALAPGSASSSTPALSPSV